RLLSHAIAVVEGVPRTEDTSLRIGVLLSMLGLYYKTRAEFEKAETYLSSTVELAEKTLPPGHREIATRLNNLAQLLQDTNRLAEAGPLMRRALEIDEASFGPGHPNVGIRLNNLALLLQATDRLAEAEPLMRRALEIDEASFGPDHPNVGTNLNN